MSATKEFGYDKKQIVGSVDDDLLCVICFSNISFIFCNTSRPAQGASRVHQVRRHVLQALH